ncbi:MAG: hypothetical protein GY707_18750 [Desulfobacteraceae bacterium]|nr:hypothetical protein [Desulfobacteraceae bacterium]
MANIIFGTLFLLMGLFLNPKNRRPKNIPRFTEKPFLWLINSNLGEENQVRYAKIFFFFISTAFVVFGFQALLKGCFYFFLM